MTSLRRPLLAASALAHAAMFALLLNATVTPSQPAEVNAFPVAFLSKAAGAPAAAKGKTLTESPKTQPLAEGSPGASTLPPQEAAASQASDTDAEKTFDTVALSVTTAAEAVGGETCNLTAWLSLALESDASVQAALLSIPRPARSVANALMLWDGAWTTSPTGPSAAFAALRRAVLSGVQAAPEACRQAPIQGPELLALRSGDLTTVVAIGSGAWRWEDLVTTDVDSFAVAERWGKPSARSARAINRSRR